MSQARNRQAWNLVARQQGIVARGQLLALGFSAAAIQHRIAYRRLHPVARGIYAVGWPYLDRRRRWAAAVLAAAGSAPAGLTTMPFLGGGVVLSHQSAADLWGIGKEKDTIDLTVRGSRGVRRPGLRVRRRSSLAAAEVRWHRGAPGDLTGTDPRRYRQRTRPDRHRARGKRRRQARLDRPGGPPRSSSRTMRASPESGRCARCWIGSRFASRTPTSRSTSAPLPPQPASPHPSENTGSTASKSTSSGPTWVWSSRPTDSAITARRRPKNATPSAIAPMCSPA